MVEQRGASSLSVQDDVARRARSLIGRLPDSKRRKLNVVASEKKADVALLPEDKALEVLRNHPIVRMFRLNVQEVHLATSKLLSPVQATPKPPQRPPPPLKHDAAERCRHCKRGVLVSSKECVACSECGIVDRGVIDVGNPYREFEDRPTRRHFEYVQHHDNGGMHDSVQLVGGHTEMSHAKMLEASCLLRAHPHLAEGVVAAAAALIVVTMTYNSSTGTLCAPPSPIGFRCATCGEKMGCMRSARFHCRGGGSRRQEARARASACYPRRP